MKFSVASKINDEFINDDPSMLFSKSTAWTSQTLGFSDNSVSRLLSI